MKDFWSNPFVGLGSVVLICALLVFAVMRIAVPTLQRTVKVPPPTVGVQHPGASLQWKEPLKGPFSASAMIEVPLPHGKYSEPSLQFNLGDYAHRTSWEAGIIHARRYNHHLATYVAVASPAHRFQVTYLAPIADAPHKLGLLREGNTIVATLDGAVLHRFDEVPVTPNADLRLVLATSFAGSDEVATGSAWDMHVTDLSAAPASVQEPRCSSAWGGITFTSKNSRWALAGTTDETQTAVVNSCIK